MGTMKADRPVNLKVTSLPITAVVSITHRITGMLLFLGAALLLYLLDLALTSDAGLAQARAFAQGGFVKLLLWLTLVALGYHFVAGVKHILLDFHVGDTIAAARAGSWATLIVSAVLAVLAGAWVW